MHRAMVIMVLGMAASTSASWAQVAPPVIPFPAKPAPTAPAPIYLVEQLVIQGPLPPVLAEKMRPLKTLQQVEDLLKASNVGFLWQRGQINTAVLDPRLVQQIDGLPPGEVIVMPQADRVFIMVVTGRR